MKNFVRPFDLNRPPLLRILLIKGAKTYHILMLDMHHIISDGVSQSILIEEIVTLYQEKELIHLKFRYKDFSEWQINMLNSEKIAKQERYWLNHFKGEIPILQVPVDHPRASGQSFAGEDLDFEIPAELTSQFKTLITKSGTTLYIALLALFSILLAKYTWETDIIIGSPIAGRWQADLDNVVGMFVNVLLMRSFPKPAKTFVEFLQEVKNDTLEAFENQDYPFDNLVERLRVNRDTEKNPLYNVIFALMNMEKPKIRLSGLNIEPSTFEEMTAKTELRLGAMETENTIMMKWSYVTALFERETIAEMAGHYVDILEQVVRNNKIKLKDIKISHHLLKLKPAALRSQQTEFDF